MAMTVDDPGPHVGFLWENQSWGLTNSDNSGEGKEKLDMKPTNQKEGNEREALVYKKRSRGIAGTSGEKNIITSGEGKDGKCRESDHEMHIWTERERRKRMRNMFAALHALLPQLPPKQADKTTIVDEAVNYIKNLQQTLEKLEKKKQERLQNVSPFGCELAVINSLWHPYDSKEAFIADKGSSNNLSSAIGTSNPSNASSAPGNPVAFQTWSSPNVVLNMYGDKAQFCICAPKKPGLLTTIAFVLEKYKIDVISANILCNGNGNMYMILAHAKRASHQFQDPKSMGENYRQAAGDIMLWIA